MATYQSNWRLLRALAAGAAAAALMPSPALAAMAAPSTYTVIAYNDLGMHCMNADFSEIMVLPPYNTVHAQLIRRGSSPDFETSTGDWEVRYFFPNNTHAADKTNFWDFWPPIFGPAQPPNIGLTGNGMSGTMTPTGANDWSVTGIPIVPTDDNGRENPYQLMNIEVVRRGTGAVVARTQTVVPVSTELSCNLCHNDPTVSTATDILLDHDRLHGTNLVDNKPVLCAECHGSNALGLPGQPGLGNLSSVVHTAHAPRMGQAGLAVDCYACHPGIRTQCQRDVHLSNGMDCLDCHGDMAAVGSPTRNPWVDEPRCGDCHTRPGFDFEQPGTLYRDSKGHSNVHCYVCHGSPHATTPTTTESDNVQALRLQGHAGKIDTCTVCHTSTPGEPFFHRVGD